MSRASERAYNTIREMIMSGKLAPGDALGEEVLSERCGVSRTPVRDALRRLETEMLVARTETQRSYVSDWSLEDIADLFELRAMLEGHAARRAAERMDDLTLKALHACNTDLREAVTASPPQVDRFLDRNREFHGLVLKAAGSRKLVSLLASVIEQPVVWRTAHHYGHDELHRSCGEHDELLSAFTRRDGGWAESIMASHIRRAFHAYADAHSSLTASVKQGRSGMA